MADISPVIPALRYRDAHAAIALLVDGFGFALNALHEGENRAVEHAQLTFGSGMVMLGSAREDAFSDLGPSSIYVIVDDCDAHYARAAAAGAEIVMEPEDEDYGGRLYAARDHEGNVWSFGTYRPQ